MGGLSGEQKLVVTTEVTGPKNDDDIRNLAKELAAVLARYNGKITSVSKEPK